jgi:hypothetical protein
MNFNTPIVAQACQDIDDLGYQQRLKLLQWLADDEKSIEKLKQVISKYRSGISGKIAMDAQIYM